MLKRTLLWASERESLRRRIPQISLARRAVRRFMPGETLDEALGAAARLEAAGLPTVLTHLGEDVADRGAVGRVVDEYSAALRGIARAGLDVELSVKPTQFGLDLDPELCFEAMARIADDTREMGLTTWVDMESSRRVDVTLELYRRLRERGRGVGVCLQAYLHRTPDDLDALLPLEPAIRLVKGAYREPESLAIQDRDGVDRRFVELGRVLLRARAADGGTRAVFGTHDMGLLGELDAEARTLGLPGDEPECHMLYGIRSDQQRRLASEGRATRVLISYGEAWFPWYMRRLAERPANLLFAMRALVPQRRGGGTK
jgi:proline dehydrogenase